MQWGRIAHCSLFVSHETEVRVNPVPLCASNGAKSGAGFFNIRDLRYDPFMHSPGKLVLIIGPSGVGKSVILKKLRARHPELLFPRSATTRERRKGEGTDLYHFVSDEEFSKFEADQKLLESAVVHGGARYGTLISEIIPPIEAGKTVVREVDVQGFDSIRSHPLFSGNPPAHALQSIFILPESKEQLIGHIRKRAPIAGDELQRRIESMEKELTYAELCDSKVRNIEGKLGDTLAAVERELKR